MKKFKKGDKISIKKRFQEMGRLITPFIKKYHEPVLVHSTPNSATFKRILKEAKLKVPNKNNVNKNAFIEKKFKMYPSIFLSLGFAYACAYDFKYSLIFSLDYLKVLDYYKNSISYQAYKKIIQYLDKHDPRCLERLADKNLTCKEVLNKFYNKTYLGKKRVLFDFWKIEKETFELIQNHPKKESLMKIIQKVIGKKHILYPFSKKVALKDYTIDIVPEIISKEDINLLNNEYFLGFYIRSKIPNDILTILKNKYPNKIIFDGKKIKIIKEPSRSFKNPLK